eukprot:1158268-Pelagomonas_calceolata.AAC.6
MQGEEFKDISASTLRGEEAVGHLGLWPEAALINHSCTPNATTVDQNRCANQRDQRNKENGARGAIKGTSAAKRMELGVLSKRPLQQRKWS